MTYGYKGGRDQSHQIRYNKDEKYYVKRIIKDA